MIKKKYQPKTIRHPERKEERVNLGRWIFRKQVNRNKQHYDDKVNEIIELYHALCMMPDNQLIPNYKTEIFNACNVRWLNYCATKRFNFPRPDKEFFKEQMKLTLIHKI